jgi:endonuclease G
MSMQGNEERLARITARLEGSPGLRAAVHRAAAEGRVPGELGRALGEAGVLDRVARGDALEAVVPTAALEAIVQRVGRPPLLVRDGVVQLEPLEDFPPETDSLIKGTEPLVPSVGRVVFLNHRSAWGGTGWVIRAEGSRRVVATNRHVAAMVASRARDGSGVFLRSPTTGVRYGAAIDWGEELERAPGSPAPVRVTRVRHLADAMAPDVALLEIEGDDLPSAFELAEEEAARTDLVGIVGYPAFDPRNDADDQARYFRDLYGVKRYAPGRVLQELGPGQVLTHDCTSLGGNSGSPLLRLRDGKVVGLHFSGVYGVANSAVGVGTLRQVLEGGEPTRVSIAPVAPERTSDGTHEADFFSGRAGYDPAFLAEDLAAPWPGLPEDVEEALAAPSDASEENRHELRYTHFGVKYHGARRQAVMTAVNIDGERSVRIKRDRDKWFLDARIPLEVQLTAEDYGVEIDRGHLVRREDPNWGDDVEQGSDGPTSVTAALANDDTFHYVNAALQASGLNRSTHQWLGLENYLLDSVRTHGFRLCVFTGPVLRVDDPELEEGLQVPQEFWKVAVMVDADTGGLHATAYVLSQGDMIRDLLEKRSRTEAVEGFTLGEYRTFQVAVRDLADVTGYDFSAYVDADPLARAVGEEALAAGAPVYVALDSVESVVV